MRGAVSFGEQKHGFALKARKSSRHLRDQAGRWRGRGNGSYQAGEELAGRDLAGEQPPQRCRIGQPVPVMLAQGLRRRGGGVILDGPWVGQDKRIAARAPGQHQRAGCIAIAHADHLRKLWAVGAESRERSCDIGRTRSEISIGTAAVADPAPVEAQYRVARARDPRR